MPWGNGVLVAAEQWFSKALYGHYSICVMVCNRPKTFSRYNGNHKALRHDVRPKDWKKRTGKKGSLRQGFVSKECKKGNGDTGSLTKQLRKGVSRSNDGRRWRT